jgi:hypothetical protein
MATPEEIELSNRRFAVEQAVKLGYAYGEPKPLETAHTFFNFLQESPSASPKQATGFMPSAKP